MGGGHGHGVTYKGVTLHQPKRWHTVTGKGLCAVMCSPYLLSLSPPLPPFSLHSTGQRYQPTLEKRILVQSIKAGGIHGKAMMIIIRIMVQC
ncbi:hypothetical protein Pfo_017113 [Paulownia fortunei]|nr:hypothetical protein Pfo_017113 [Paulownia fortunei]